MLDCFRTSAGAPSTRLGGTPDGRESAVRTAGCPVVMLVEDDDDQRYVFGEILRAGGCQVAEARCVREALDELVHRHIHCIVCDILMPDMDGHDLITAVRRDSAHSDIPVIAMSAGRGDLRSVLLEEGANAFCLKQNAWRLLCPLVRELAR